MKLWQQILLAAFLGILTGAVFPAIGIELKILGDLFLHLIHMVILPLVFSSVCVGITSIHDPAKLGRIGGKTLFLYGLTTMIAVLVGISFCLLFEPGLGLKIGSISSIQTNKAPKLIDILTNLIPKNPVKAFVDGNVLQVIFFSVFFGISIGLVGEKAKPVENLLRGIAQAMFKLTHFVISLSPLGVFGIMAWASATFGFTALLMLGKFLLTYYGACLFHILFVYGGLTLIAHIPFKKVLKGSWSACVMAFSTCSSSASLPVALDCAVEKMGVSPSVANFMLPLGTTINMNGAAIFQGMSALFLCQAYGIHLDITQIITLVSVATLSSVGSCGIPGTGFIMLSVVLSSVGIPLEGLALLAGIDRLREMVSTVVNILGDLVCTVVVARQEKELDYEKFLAI